jgi:hypothetical protein
MPGAEFWKRSEFSHHVHLELTLNARSLRIFWSYLLPILPAWPTSSGRHSCVKPLTSLQVEFWHLPLLEWQL